jgi:SAM-dependent methyltransferase
MFPNNSSKQLEMCDELPFWSAPFGIKLLDKIKYKTDISCLDIGFGTGFPIIEIAQRLGNSCKIYGIDPSDDFINHTAKKIENLKLNNVNLLKGFAENIPLYDNSIDLISSNNGINNVFDLNKVFSECSRILKKGGQFVFTMNTNLTMIEFYLEFEKTLSELKMFDEINKLKEHINCKRPPIALVSNLLSSHNFVINSIEYDNFNYKFADINSMLNHNFIKSAFINSWIDLLPESKVMEVFQLVLEKVEIQLKMFGEIKLSIPFVTIDCFQN